MGKKNAFDQLREMNDTHELKQEALYAFEVFEKHIGEVKDPEVAVCLESLKTVAVALVNGAFDE